MAKKPKWVVEKEQAKRARAAETLWLFGLHAVRDALENPRRERLQLIVTPNAQAKLADAIEASGMTPEVQDPRKFRAPLDPGSVHQGAALEVKPLDWGPLAEMAIPEGERPARLVLLDRVTDPHNVGAILRSAEVFGAVAVIGTIHHAAPRDRGARQDRQRGARAPALPARAQPRRDDPGAAGHGLPRAGSRRRGAADGRGGHRRAPRPPDRPGAGRRGAGVAPENPRDLRRAGADRFRGRLRLAQRVERGGGGALRSASMSLRTDRRASISG
ncbi:23S rRNA (guanosine-2'-O-) -methyltransferase rlmB [Salipiger mucosus DSM 16094]|uniref:23S rRNA (Guanosine-2'-O-)-methyltransferase rlmB n=1 Tax=Salipiger mucosus DSM 16094 TaxID=1123237 RepID=S9QQV3_9RHOB|nr:23S rRNA (guanosine-2'-O-) -methyltransferase rlmB [Salipiger mucosus DSM 16094]